MKPTFFATPEAFRTWLEEHHGRAAELLVGFYKVGSGKPSITWPESVDAALCYGWIDGVRKRIDGDSYTIRFTPRKGTSTWSMVNIQRAHELTKMGLMRPAGLDAFAKRDEKKSATYSYEQRTSAKFSEAHEKQFRAEAKAWQFFEAQAPSYRRIITYWVMSAQKEETRRKRLQKLIEECAQQRRLR